MSFGVTWRKIVFALPFVWLSVLGAQTSLLKPKIVVHFYSTEDGYILLNASFGYEKTGVLLLDSGQTHVAILDRESFSDFHFKSKWKSELRLQGYNPHKVVTTDWRKVEIRQGKTVFAKGNFPAIDYSLNSRVIGTNLSGMLGLPVLTRYVVRLDYDTGEMSFFDPRKFQYSGTGQVLKLQESGEAGLLLIRAVVTLSNCEVLPVTFAVDTGANGDIVFNGKFLKDNPDYPVGDMPEGTVAIGSDTLDGGVVELYGITIGNLSLRTPQVGVLRKESADILRSVSDGSLGTGILSQFNIIVDKPHGQIILEPRSGKPLDIVAPCVAKQSNK